MPYLEIDCPKCKKNIAYRQMSRALSDYYIKEAKTDSRIYIFRDGNVHQYLHCIDCVIDEKERKEHEAAES